MSGEGSCNLSYQKQEGEMSSWGIVLDLVLIHGSVGTFCHMK
jgi:hypothetical protein